MDLLENLVIPPSANHVLLVKYILIISLLLFIPYISMVLGGSFISDYFNKKGKKTGDKRYLRFAKDVIEKLTITRSAELALGAIPAASILFAYAQLMFASQSITINIMAVSVVLFMISFVLIYRYRNSFQVIGMLDKVKEMVGDDGKATIEIGKFEEKVLSSNSLAFNIGKWLLFGSAYLFTGTRSLAGNPLRWAEVGNILQVIFSWQTIFDFITFLSIAGTVTGAAILFFFFSWNKGIKDMDEPYSKFVKNFAGGLTLFSAALFPIAISISYLFLPPSAQSQGAFMFFVLVIVLALILCNYIYVMVKNSDTQPASIVFGLIITLLLLNIVKDQTAFGSAIDPQIIITTKAAEELEKEAKSKTVSTSGIDAQQIYNTKCIACHKFDQKVVGPPYQQTVPKYNGDVNALAEFIYNPIKKNPDFPPMPNQGLKKKEALAMAKWLIDQVAGKK
jgi:cytochrome c